MIQQVHEIECLHVTSDGCRTHLWQSSFHEIWNIIFGVTQSTKAILDLHDAHEATYCVCQNQTCEVRQKCPYWFCHISIPCDRRITIVRAS